MQGVIYLYKRYNILKHFHKNKRKHIRKRNSTSIAAGYLFSLLGENIEIRMMILHCKIKRGKENKHKIYDPSYSLPLTLTRLSLSRLSLSLSTSHSLFLYLPFTKDHHGGIHLLN
eukprot:sb/3476700/